MADTGTHNQTQFSTEQPFFEQPVVPPTEERLVKPKVPFFKRRKTIVAAIILTTAMTLLLLFALNAYIEYRKRLGIGPAVIVPTPTPEAANQYVLEVEQLQKEWKAADPNQSELQPPAVDMSLRLDSTRRR